MNHWGSNRIKHFVFVLGFWLSFFVTEHANATDSILRTSMVLNPDLHSAFAHRFIQNANQRWYPHRLFFTPGKEGCDYRQNISDLIIGNQWLALSRFEQDRYINPVQRKILEKNFKNYTDRPVTTYIYLSDHPPKDQSKFPEGLAGYHSWNKLDGTTQFQYQHGNLILISGQILQRKKSGFEFIAKKLPWEDDLAFPKLDRKKYPLVFEIGRVTADHHKSFEAMVSHALLDTFHQTWIYQRAGHNFAGIEPHLTFHALDESRTRLFKALTKTNPLFTDPKDPGNNVFVVPLSKMIETFRPETKIESLAYLKSKGIAPFHRARHPIEHARTWSDQSLDHSFLNELSETPIQVASTSFHHPLISNRLVELQTGIPIKNLEEALYGKGDYMDSYNPEAPIPHLIRDPGFAVLQREDTKLKPSYVISNLDPSKTMNTEYTKDFIEKAINGILHANLPPHPKGMNITPFVPEFMNTYFQAIKESQIGFEIRTSYPHTARAIEDLGFKKMEPLKGNESQRNFWWEEAERRTDGKLKRPGNEVFRFEITEQQIRKMVSLQKAAKPGYYQWAIGVIQ